MRREKGSITIFSLLSLLLVTAALFALLEGSRFQELQRFADLQTETALESVFANYNTCLWKEYHLLGANQIQMEEVLEITGNGKVGGGKASLLTFEAEKIEIEDTRLTDGGGTVFINSVSSYMKANILYESAKEIYNQYEAIKNIMEYNQSDVSNIEEALKEAQSIQMQQGPVSTGTAGSQSEPSKIDPVSILEDAKKLQKFGILELVLEDTSKVSDAECDFSSGLLERELEAGKSNRVIANDWMDWVLLQQYLMTHMSNFRESQSGRALNYELEYLLGEKTSDVENLKVAVAKLLAVREAANFLYLVSDPVKSQQAETMATLIGGTSLNPAIIQVIEIGLLTAWAFGESILDVRALLAGKRIPLLKSEETWTLELENIGKISQEFTMAKESAWGLNYESYLGILLLFEEEQNLAMKTMNVQEATIRKQYGDSSFRLDSLMTQAEVQICYSYEPIFPFLRVIDAEKRWEYSVYGNTSYGYY